MKFLQLGIEDAKTRDAHDKIASHTRGTRYERNEAETKRVENNENGTGNFS